MTDEDILKVTLEEYRHLWTYYHKLLVEWKNFIDWYFKAVTLPAGVLGYVAVSGPGSPELPDNVFAGVLATVSLVGLALYVGYAKEVRNGRNYELAMASVRAFLREREPALGPVLKIDSLRAERRRGRSGSIALWRGFSMAIINSALGSGALAVILPERWPISLSSFAAFFLLHYVLFRSFAVIAPPELAHNQAPADGRASRAAEGQ